MANIQNIIGAGNQAAGTSAAGGALHHESITKNRNILNTSRELNILTGDYAVDDNGEIKMCTTVKQMVVLKLFHELVVEEYPTINKPIRMAIKRDINSLLAPYTSTGKLQIDNLSVDNVAGRLQINITCTDLTANINETFELVR
jgi:hypothetical protein